MADKITLNLPNGYKIIAEASTDTDYPNELYVYLESDDGSITQDLAMVKYDKDNPPTFPISAYVWGDKCDEDYTNKFYIGIYESEDD